jgi:hypothetical protein
MRERDDSRPDGGFPEGETCKCVCDELVVVARREWSRWLAGRAGGLALGGCT